MNTDDILRKHHTLETERLILRRFRPEDTDSAYEYMCDETVTRFLTWEPYTSREAALEFIENVQDSPNIYCISLKDSGRCIGCIDIRPMPEDKKAGFGYVLARKYWNQGYMSEALTPIIRLAFDALGVNRVESTYYVGNEGSGRVMEKCGMEYEGTFRQEKIIKGQAVDVVHYAILRDKFERMQNRFA